MEDTSVCTHTPSRGPRATLCVWLGRLPVVSPIAEGPLNWEPCHVWLNGGRNETQIF